MRRYKSETGAALVLLIGITVALAVIAGMLAMVVVNQTGATGADRSSKQSFYVAEAALDSAAQFAKVDKTMSTTEEWLTPEELSAAFAGTFPAGATVDFRVYDNLDTVDYDIKWDDNEDDRVWVEATVEFQGKTTRTRVLVEQRLMPFAEALPKAVTYSDTGIRLEDRSDIYAVNADGTPDTSGPPYQTSITAGGTWNPGLSGSWAEVGRFTANATSNLAAPGTTTQSLGIKVNGSVSLAGHSFDDVLVQPASVGYLSDYFDQKAQADLADESQAGGTPEAAPAAPGSWTSSGFTTITTTVLNTLQSTSSTTTYNATADLVRSGNLTLSRGTSTTGRTFNFRRLYVTGNLTLTGPVTVNCTSLYVGGTLTINNTTTTAVADNFGPLYVNSTSASSVSGRVSLTTSSARTRGNLTIANTTTTARTDQFGSVLYVDGSLSVSGNVTTTATSVYAGTDCTFTGPSSPVTHTFGLVYTNATTGTLLFSGNVQVKTSAVVANGDFTISGATTAVTNWLGHVYVKAVPSAETGDVNWSGTASVTSRDYQNPTADPLPLWLGEYWSRTGTYNDEYGPIWVPGNSSTSVVFGSTGASTIMCPLLCTTEKTTVSGNVTFGTREHPMVYFFMCDNNGIYPQVVDWAGTGTYYGLMVINESTINISGGVATKPSVQGAIFAGCPYDPTHTSGMSMSDIVLEGDSCVAYDQSVVGAIATSSLRTTTLVTQTVPGSWQQLPLN